MGSAVVDEGHLSPDLVGWELTAEPTKKKIRLRVYLRLPRGLLGHEVLEKSSQPLVPARRRAIGLRHVPEVTDLVIHLPVLFGIFKRRRGLDDGRHVRL
jgi:hypothetical protein